MKKDIFKLLDVICPKCGKEFEHFCRVRLKKNEKFCPSCERIALKEKRQRANEKRKQKRLAGEK